ncbi:MAG: tRNA (adenosine(37)-N6)-dimethylallyltransferase MiaA [Blautia sp.]|jgi:tRNA dimethylallyltransferase
MKPPLIVLSGPTAVGKTKLSLSLAKAVGGEIVSADSMQVYQYMDIGSAKIRPEEMDYVPHHLVDVLDPREEFHIVRFQEMAKEAMKGIYQRGKIPILTGGTGFYIQAVTKDIDFTASHGDESYRQKLEALANEQGPEVLHQRLAQVDPESAREIHANNVKRVIRALEFYEENHRPISAHNRQQKEKESPYNLAYFVLTDDRAALYAQIDRRVDQMMAEGLVEEVRHLREMGCQKDMVSMQGLGYKEILAYLDGEYPLEEAVRILKRDTRHFAKRQLTWFKREPEAIWLDKREFDHRDDALLHKMLEICTERGIIK